MSVSHLKFEELPKKEWDLLEFLAKANSLPGAQLVSKDMVTWEITEELGKFKFRMNRNKVSGARKTEIDDLGCVGFSTINVNDTRVYLTEGVSDYFTVKLTHPNMNVLGLTTLGGNNRTRAIISTLFDNICIVSDNDYNSAQNTGLMNSRKMQKFYESLGKKVKIILPETGFKDVTEQFISDLKFAKADILNKQ